MTRRSLGRQDKLDPNIRHGLNYELARLPAALEQLRLDRQPYTFVRANALPLEFIRHFLGRDFDDCGRTNKTNVTKLFMLTNLRVPGYTLRRYPQLEHHRYGRSPCPRCRSGCPERARTDPGMARPSARPAAPARAKLGSRPCLRSRFCPPVRDPRPAGPAPRLGARRCRIDPRCEANRHRLDGPGPRHRTGAPGLAGAIPRHGLRWQPEGVPPRPSAVRRAMAGKRGHRARHDRPVQDDPGRRRHGSAAGAAGRAKRSIARVAQYAGRSRACRVAAVPAACLSRAATAPPTGPPFDHHDHVRRA